jgi:hypothetical protein
VQVHLLSENRGSALETGTISRIKMVSSMKEMSEVCSDSFLHSIIRMLTTWSAAQGHSHNLTHIAVQLPIAKVRFVAVSATIPNIQVQFLPLGCYSYALGYNQARKTE